MHFLELEVAVPGGGHEYVAYNEEDYSNDSGFHGGVVSVWWLVVWEVASPSRLSSVGPQGHSLV